MGAKVVEVVVSPASLNGSSPTRVPLFDTVQTFGPNAVDQTVVYDQVARTSLLHSWFAENTIVDPKIPTPHLTIDQSVPTIDVDMSNANTELIYRVSHPYSQKFHEEFPLPAGKTLQITAYSEQIPVMKLTFEVVFTIVGAGVALVDYGSNTVERLPFGLGQACKRSEDINLPVPRTTVLGNETIKVVCGGYYVGTFSRGFAVDAVFV